MPLLIVEPKQKLIPSAPDRMIPEPAYDTIRTPIIFDFDRRVIIPWSVRRVSDAKLNATGRDFCQIWRDWAFHIICD